MNTSEPRLPSGGCVADLCEKLCAASLQARPGGIRDSLRRGAGQGAVRLLRFATALRVTAPLGCGSRRLKGATVEGIGEAGPFGAPSGASFPSLPAGINTDDSDPLGAGVGACHIAPLHGTAGTPLLGGVAIVFPDFSVSSLWKPNSSGKPQKTKDFKECGGVPPPQLFMPHPPLCPCGKK